MLFYRIKIYRLKRKISKNPYLGIKEDADIYVYRQGSFIIKYKILNTDDKEVRKPLIEIISIKHKLTESEITIRRMREFFRGIFRYQGWIYLFKPSIFIPVMLGITILYFGIFEPYQKKVDRFRWIVAKVIGVELSSVEYRGGLLTILSKRDTVHKKGVQDYECISFTFGPPNIFSLQTMGSVTRWDKDVGYITHPISYDDVGNVWIKYRDTWEHGIVTNNQVKWDESLGTVRWPISRHEIPKGAKDLRITDQR